MFETMLQVLRLLHDRTRDGRVSWEYFPDDEMIRAKVGSGYIRIGKEVTDLTRPDGRELKNVTAYHVYVIDHFGRTQDVFILTPGDADYGTVESVYRLGRQGAKNTNQVLREMIEALSK